MKNEPLVMERQFDAPIQQVWEAITDTSIMQHWYFDISKCKAEPGFECLLYGSKDEKSYLHLCKVTAVEPGKKLTYSWRYKDYPGESFVTFELFDEAGKTRLVLTHAGLDTFATDNPDFAKENFNQGWNHILGTNLRKFVEASQVTVQA
jgi:uncharacterized protein YndB with AHSA1/START domain